MSRDVFLINFPQNGVGAEIVDGGRRRHRRRLSSLSFTLSLFYSLAGNARALCDLKISFSPHTPQPTKETHFVNLGFCII